MNQEYILLAGWWWRFAGKKVFLWRNHPAGNRLTDLTAMFCERIFCTSRYSYTAKYKKTVLMPVGIDTELFYLDPKAPPASNTILFLGRMAPIKRPDLLLGVLGKLRAAGAKFVASFYGAPLSADQRYYENLRERAEREGFSNSVNFYPAVTNASTPAIYRQHQIFVNLSPSGMYDKTIFEAMACGCLVLSSNSNLTGQVDARLLFPEGDGAALAVRLTALLNLEPAIRETIRVAGWRLVQSRHGLSALAQKLFAIMTS